MNHRRALVVDDELGMRAALDAMLRTAGWQVECAVGVGEGVRRFVTGRHGLVITDMRMPDGDGLQLMRAVRQISPNTPVILLTAYGSVPDAVEAIKTGACDYLVKPVTAEHLLDVIDRLAGARASAESKTAIIGESPALKRSLEYAALAARTSADVLIEAESGTGKELLAKYIHEHSARRAGPFIAINCAAVPETLLESELFGYAKGAFTGAAATKRGKFELSAGGTLLLDEIGEMPLTIQPKLLRALQERRVERLGSTQSIACDVRVIATTNRSLRAAVQQGQFRADLYFRLNVIPLSLPPLRDRCEDIPALTHYFVASFTEPGRDSPQVTEDFISALQKSSWPGNVRELANVVRRAMIFSDGDALTPKALTFCVAPAVDDISVNPRQLTLRDAERELFERALAQTNGNRTRTAEVLGVSLRTVRNKIRAYGLGPRMSA